MRSQGGHAHSSVAFQELSLIQPSVQNWELKQKVVQGTRSQRCSHELNQVLYQQNLLEVHSLVGRQKSNSKQEQNNSVQLGVGKRKPTSKNVLRNLGVGLLNFLKLSNKSHQYLDSLQKNNKQCLLQHIYSAQLINFRDYQKLWGVECRSGCRPKLAELSRIFLEEEVLPYIFYSKIQRGQMRRVHIRRIWQLLKGLDDPKSFQCFS